MGPLREWAQPGIGHGRRSIIVSVVSRGGGRMCGGHGVKAPLGDCYEDCREGHFRSDVVGGIVDKVVEFGNSCCGTDGECEGPGWVIREVVDLCLLLECRACLLVWCEVCGAEEEVGAAVAAAGPSN